MSCMSIFLVVLSKVGCHDAVPCSMFAVQQRPLLRILFFDPLFKVLYLPSLLSLRPRWVNARQVTQTCRLILCKHCHLCGHSSCLRNFFCSFSFLNLVSRKFI